MDSLFEINENYEKDLKDTNWILEKLSIERKKIKSEIMDGNNTNYNYKCFKNTLSNSMCDFIINESEKFALENKSVINLDGWEHSRHKNYPTTDLPIKKIKNLETIITNIVKIDIFDIISKTYNINKYYLDCNDIFVVKYKSSAQSYLGKHRDGSAFSFNILLNSNENFIGGGTLIEENGQNTLVSNTKGGMILHRGCVLHEGKKIISGTRYILVGFISYLKNYEIDFELVSRSKLNYKIDLDSIENQQNEMEFKHSNIEFDEPMQLNTLIPMIKSKKSYLLNTQKEKFNLLEKIIYELAMYQFKQLNIIYDPEKHWIEYWTKKEIITKEIIHDFHSDKDEKNYFTYNLLINPLLSTVTYLTDSEFPTIITNVDENKNFLKTTNKKVLLSFPQKLKHISFNGKYLHGVCNIKSNIKFENRLENSPRLTIMFNIWDHKPMSLEFPSEFPIEYPLKCHLECPNDNLGELYSNKHNIIKHINLNDQIGLIQTEQEMIDKIISNYLRKNPVSNQTYFAIDKLDLYGNILFTGK